MPYQVNEDRDKVCGAALASNRPAHVFISWSLTGCPSLVDGYDGGSAEQRVRFFLHNGIIQPSYRRAGHDRCAELRGRIQQITDGEYANAKRDVDALRAELGQPPLPSLQATLEEKSQQYAAIPH